MSHMTNNTGVQQAADATDDVFGTWQPRYAERGIATFPVRFAVLASGKLDKRPMVQHWMKMGVRASTHLTRKFASAQGIGITLGARNGLAVADVDTKDENVVADVLAYYGASPLIARSPSSGGFHVYYKHNGRQRRRIRDSYWRQRGAPVDVLGGGCVVVPPSRTPSGVYAFVQGGLDDLQRLPILRASADKITPSEPEPVSPPESPLRGMREHDGRNTVLFMAIGPIARDIHQACGTREQLLQIAREHNAQCGQPMELGEMNKTVDSVWRMTLEDRNHIGLHGAFIELTEMNIMLSDDQDAMMLLLFLRAHNNRSALFMCTNGLAETFGWHRLRLAAARRRLIELGYLEPVRQAGRGHPALFQWRRY
jgi:hypothetical protein